MFFFKKGVYCFLLIAFLFLLPYCTPSHKQVVEQEQTISSASEAGVSSRKEPALSSTSPSLQENASSNFSGVDKQRIENSVQAPGGYSPKITYTVHLTLQVQDLKKIENFIPALLTQNQGYIAQQRYQQPSEKESLFYILKVNAAALDSVVQKLCSLAIFIQHKSIEGNDVSQQYYDAETRLTSKKQALEQYKAILKKAATVKEILEIEDRLRIIQEEIEALQGQLRFYEHSVVYATIFVEFYKLSGAKGLPENSFFYKVGKALAGGWELLIEVIIVILYVWPFLVIAAVFYFFFRRKQKAKKGSAVSSSQQIDQLPKI